MKAPPIVSVEVSMRARALEAAQRARDAGFLHFSAALLEVARRAPPGSFDHDGKDVSTLTIHSHENQS